MVPHYTLRADMGDVMVLIGDGNSEIGANVRIDHCYMICLRDLIMSRAVTRADLFFLQKDLFSFMCAQHVLSHYLIYELLTYCRKSQSDMP